MSLWPLNDVDVILNGCASLVHVCVEHPNTCEYVIAGVAHFELLMGEAITPQGFYGQEDTVELDEIYKPPPHGVRTLSLSDYVVDNAASAEVILIENDSKECLDAATDPADHVVAALLQTGVNFGLLNLRDQLPGHKCEWHARAMYGLYITLCTQLEVNLYELLFLVCSGLLPPDDQERLHTVRTLLLTPFAPEIQKEHALLALKEANVRALFECKLTEDAERTIFSGQIATGLLLADGVFKDERVWIPLEKVKSWKSRPCCVIGDPLSDPRCIMPLVQWLQRRLGKHMLAQLRTMPSDDSTCCLEIQHSLSEGDTALMILVEDVHTVVALANATSGIAVVGRRHVEGVLGGLACALDITMGTTEGEALLYYPASTGNEFVLVPSRNKILSYPCLFEATEDAKGIAWNVMLRDIVSERHDHSKFIHMGSPAGLWEQCHDPQFKEAAIPLEKLAMGLEGQYSNGVEWKFPREQLLYHNMQHLPRSVYLSRVFLDWRHRRSVSDPYYLPPPCAAASTGGQQYEESFEESVCEILPEPIDPTLGTRKPLPFDLEDFKESVAWSGGGRMSFEADHVPPESTSGHLYVPPEDAVVVADNIHSLLIARLPRICRTCKAEHMRMPFYFLTKARIGTLSVPPNNASNQKPVI